MNSDAHSSTRSQKSRQATPGAQRVKVLLVDDEADSLFPTMAQNLNPLGFDLAKEADAANALVTIKAEVPHLVLLDLHFPGDESRSDGRTLGGQLLGEIRRKFESLPVIVFTTRLDDVDIPLEPFERQPHGYFAKPNFTTDASWAKRLGNAIRDAIDTADFLRAPDETEIGFFVGRSKEMQDVAARVRTAARNKLPILIYGESGSGRRLIAQAIHKLSRRSGRSEHYNCLGDDSDAVEEVLFGLELQEPDAISKPRPSLFELADKGSLFLEDFEAIPINLQHKLVDAIESESFRPIGGSTQRKVDVRLIASTRHNLSDLVADGILATELALQLGVSVIVLPSLKDRIQDLPELYHRFVDKANEMTRRSVLPILRPETRCKLEEHDWPGNIRELETVILRAVARTASNVLLPDDLELVPVARASIAATGRASPSSSMSSGAPTAGVAAARVVETLTDHLESLEVGARYDFIKDQARELQRGVLGELVCRLRARTGRRVTHKVLAFALHPLKDHERDSNKIRQFLHACDVRLTQLECNQ